MGRFSHLDTDEERLPEGMQRIGYDADTETYTFQDVDGNIWEGPPGSRHGHLTRVSGPSNIEDGGEDPDDDEAPPPYRPTATSANGYTPLGHDGEHVQRHWRADLMPLLNFGLLIGLCLLGLFWLLYLRRPAAAPFESDACGDRTFTHWIEKGDTCWAITQKYHIILDDLLAVNPNINCDALRPGRAMCVPHT
jgi:hypothetical protein